MFIVKNARTKRFVTVGRTGNGPLSTTRFIQKAKLYKSRGGALRSVGVRTEHEIKRKGVWGGRLRVTSHHRCSMPRGYIIQEYKPVVAKKRKRLI